MFKQPCWVFNNLQFRDCTYSVPFVHLPRKLYYTRRIIHIKNVSSPYSCRSRCPPSLLQHAFGVLRSRRPLKHVKNIKCYKVSDLNNRKSSKPTRTTLKHKISFDNTVRQFLSWVTSLRMGRFLQALLINTNAPKRANITAAQITNDVCRRCWVTNRIGGMGEGGNVQWSCLSKAITQGYQMSWTQNRDPVLPRPQTTLHHKNTAQIRKSKLQRCQKRVNGGGNHSSNTC
jgi:hypothetical protein